MEIPFFSICIPTYKQPQLLNKLLSTINKQSFRDFEVIISDDSGDDSVLQEVKKHWTFDIKYFKNEKPLGSPENWNNAIDKAIGKWIKLMHHDDCFSNEKSLEIMYDNISKNNEIDFFFCSTVIYKSLSKETILYNPSENYINSLKELPINLFLANVIGAPSATIFKKEIPIKFNKSLVWLVDIEFYTQVIIKYKIQRILERLIVTSADLESQLTNSLQDNKNVEVYEFFYCYQQLLPILNKKNRILYRVVLMNLIDKYEIKLIKEIKDVYNYARINYLIYLYIKCKSIFLKKVIRKLNYIL
jgi:glycosyltransferase involved in cell wall biosynthesis